MNDTDHKSFLERRLEAFQFELKAYKEIEAEYWSEFPSVGPPDIMKEDIKLVEDKICDLEQQLEDLSNFIISGEVALRNHLWSALYLCYWSKKRHPYEEDKIGGNNLCKSVWLYYFSRAIDTYPGIDIALAEIKRYFFDSSLDTVYVFMERVVSLYPSGQTNYQFTNTCDRIFSNYNIPREFVGHKIKVIQKQGYFQ